MHLRSHIEESHNWLQALEAPATQREASSHRNAPKKTYCRFRLKLQQIDNAYKIKTQYRKVLLVGSLTDQELDERRDVSEIHNSALINIRFVLKCSSDQNLYK